MNSEGLMNTEVSINTEGPKNLEGSMKGEALMNYATLSYIPEAVNVTTQSPWLKACVVALTIGGNQGWVEKKLKCRLPLDTVITGYNHEKLMEICLKDHHIEMLDLLAALLIGPHDYENHCTSGKPTFVERTGQNQGRKLNNAKAGDDVSESTAGKATELFVCLYAKDGDLEATVECTLKNETYVNDNIVEKHCPMFTPGSTMWGYIQVEHLGQCINLHSTEGKSSKIESNEQFGTIVIVIDSLLCGVGVVGNTLTVIVMAKANAHPSRVYIICMVASQTVYLLFVLGGRFHAHLAFIGDSYSEMSTQLNPYLCMVLLLTENVSICLVFYLKMVGSIDRLVAVSKPMYYRQTIATGSTRKKIYLAVFGSFIFLVVAFLVQKIVFYKTLGLHSCFISANTVEVMRIYQNLNIGISIILYFIPFTVIILTSSITAIHLFQYRKERQKMLQVPNVNIENKSNRVQALKTFGQRAEVIATIAMLGVVASFTLLIVPSVIMHIYIYSVEDMEKMEFKMVLYIIANSLMMLDFSLSFFIYVATMSQFRSILKKMINLKRIPCKKPDIFSKDSGMNSKSKN
ncbi:unnamed protein product [Owenia fusiformis]|uniref:G-protein coupled receptors family 1 profile domain-containing protein n=1 Tax=Owenia fusiformis TaxID=6347 RepID=A0A8S4N532_OWEFU|nr:unnamed protein product [Owenia fusiformis]